MKPARLRPGFSLRGTLSLGLSVLGGACASGDSSVAVTRTDSAGIEIVVSHGPDRPLDWTFTPTVRIGGADTGAASFYEVGPGAVAADGAGRIFVLDRHAFRISAFDDRGKTLWSAGREGGAPGEFLFPWSVQVHGDTVAVMDGGGPELEWFAASDGSHLGSERLQQFVNRIAYAAGGRAFTFFEKTDRKGGAPPFEILGWAAGVDTTVLVSLQGSADVGLLEFPHCPVKLQAGRILEPALVWDGRGERVAASASGAYRLEVFEGAAPRMSVRRDLPTIPATAAIAAAEYPDGFRVNVPKAGLTCEMDGREVVNLLGFADVVPFVRGITIAPNGTLWVRRTPPRAQRGSFDLFLENGAYIGTLTNAPTPVAFLPDGRVLAIEKDELDIERVVVYAVAERP